MSTLVLRTTGSSIYSTETFSGVDTIQYPAEAMGVAATFSAWQFDGVQILDDVTFSGANFSDHLFVELDTDHTVLDARGWQFKLWNDPLNTVIRLYGSSGDDIILGPNVGVTMFGWGGSNKLVGGAGDDTIVSYEIAVTDVLNGGEGNDYAVLYRTGSLVSFNIDLRRGGSGIDIGDGTSLRGFEGLLFEGGSGNDHVIGGNGSTDFTLDNLDGGDGDDMLFGRAGNDQLRGGTGNDAMRGGAGSDQLTGGAGHDVTWGGAGTDSFVLTQLTDSFAGESDIIKDFEVGLDVIDLSALDAIDGEADDLFTFVGVNEFTESAGELRYRVGSARTVVSGDTNGDGIADFEIVLQGQLTLVHEDFIL